MKKWKYTINIKQFLSDEDTNEAKITACEGVVSELKRIQLRFPDDFELESIIDSFQDIREDETTNCDDFNVVLDELYDWSDYNRVWLGMS